MKFEIIDRNAFNGSKNIFIPVTADLSGLKNFLSAKDIKTLKTLSDFSLEELKECRIEKVVLENKKIYLLLFPEKPEAKDFLKCGFMFGELVRKNKISLPAVGAMEDTFKNYRKLIFTKLFLEGAGFGIYSFDRYKTKKESFDTDIFIYSGSPKNIKAVEGFICEMPYVIENINLVRDLVNMPPNDLNPEEFCRIAKSTGDGKLKYVVLSEKDLKKEDFNLILAVGDGSKNRPEFLKIYYTGDKNSKEHIAVVGKGVTFDSGGTNLKPTGSIETMKTDMAGAATALGLINLVAKLKLPVNLNVYIPLVENIIGYSAYRPGDVIVSKSGKSVEILNTDAEGRLVLADALTAAVEEGPSLIIDLATLTGACVVALGSYMSAFFTNDENLVHEIYNIADATGEDMWYFPLYKEYEKRIKGTVGDIQNISKKKGEAGTIIGALFLKEFVNDKKWIHFDIAGTAFMEEKHPYFGEGATGFGLRFLLELIKSHISGS